MDEQMTSLSCELIGYVGSAKGLFVEAIEAAMRGSVDKAKELYAEGEDAYIKGHQVHSGLLTKFASGEEVPVDILMVHAQCQMMSAEDFKVLAEKLIEYAEEKK